MDTMGAFFKVILLHAAPKDSLKAQEYEILGLAPDRLHIYILKEQLHDIYFKFFSKWFCHKPFTYRNSGTRFTAIWFYSTPPWDILKE